jgi:hypothetical protein
VAGAQILQSRPDPLGADVHSVVSGMSVVLWASGTWLIPLLLAVGHGHVMRRVPLSYDPGLCSIVFPPACQAWLAVSLAPPCERPGW